MKRQWSMVGAIVLFLIIAILSVLNVDPVPVNFGFVEVEWPLIVVIFASLLLGALIATLLSTYKAFKDQRKHKHQNTVEHSDSENNSSLYTSQTDDSTGNQVDIDNNESDLNNS
ncbi:LapA family protein [Alkalibacterium kapii]|uniref:Lipopolysaccharide assembly protein A domain-containing protein n=1 Tax=Alkalibacterium kapii TaxID=426704 RepID=A0A511AZ88_9LACT|nr:lipopolysaccharide assembly protein LapA domain-containing protein [Alkalibacterium kapii]GEK90917.1 hypothetical protein AKA01nite_05390 [Alkalibacterium kapii]